MSERCVKAGISGLDPSPARRMCVIVTLALFTAGIGILFYNTFMTAVFTIVLYRPAQRYVDDLILRKNKEILIIQFRDFLSCIASSLSTGRHMEEGIREARQELLKIYSGKDLIIIEINRVLAEVESMNGSVTEALGNFAGRADIEDIETFVRVYESCLRSGGDFVSAIHKTSDIISQKIEIEREIKQIVSQRKFEGRIITFMPIIVILFLRLLSPEYLSVMYQTAEGRIAMSAALGGVFAAYRMMERITDIEI